MRVKETAIRFVHRVIRDSKPDPENVYDEHQLAAAGYEARRKETPAETIRKGEQWEEDYDTFMQAYAWGGE